MRNGRGGKRLKNLSKFISLILRHKPEVIGIALDEHGWADVRELIDGICRTPGNEIDMETLEDSFEITTDPSAYNAVDQALRQAGYEIVMSELEQVPSVESTPDEKDLRKLKKLVDILEENDDVQNVHTNCAVDLDDIEL